MNRLNDKGAVLISVYMVLFVLMALSSSVAMFNFSELRDARRYQNSVKAFWLAEAGINEYMADASILDEVKSIKLETEDGHIKLFRDDSDPRFRLIISLGTVRGSQRQIQIKYPALTSIFESTISSKGDMIIEGSKASLMVNDKLRLAGKVINSSTIPLVFFEDVQEGVRDSLVSITYPDVDQNGVSDEFNDFVMFNRSLISKYSEDEVIYVKDNATYTIMPDSSLENKKIIYIEGDKPGQGNAVVQFTGTLAEDQNLTIITTGSVTNNQAGIASRDSQLNIIAWSDYHETSALPSVHNGMIYTHGTAYFDEVHDTSVTNGSVVANEGIVIKEIWSTKTFNYADTRNQGEVPAGFEGLVGGGVSGYTFKPNEWREMHI